MHIEIEKQSDRMFTLAFADLHRPDGSWLNTNTGFVWPAMTSLRHLVFMTLSCTVSMVSNSQPPRKPARSITLLIDFLDIAERCPKTVLRWYKDMHTIKLVYHWNSKRPRNMHGIQLVHHVRSFPPFFTTSIECSWNCSFLSITVPKYLKRSTGSTLLPSMIRLSCTGLSLKVRVHWPPIRKKAAADRLQDKIWCLDSTTSESTDWIMREIWSLIDQTCPRSCCLLSNQCQCFTEDDEMTTARRNCHQK